jgi:nucleoside-diphosphate-sugar epimerase
LIILRSLKIGLVYQYTIILMAARPEYNILLTGGSGFLGSFIIRELLDDSSPVGVQKLKILDLQEPENQSDERVSYIRGDVRDRSLLLDAFVGTDLVIHSAAIVDWGTKTEKEVMAVNYQGTLNVIEACIACQVKGLVYTSSLDVLFSGKHLIDVNEETPYPDRHSTSYCISKYMAEKKALEANGELLKTCVLRPADIYGEGDPYHIGSLIEMARKGFYVRLGNGTSKCQHVYAGNVAQAHLLAGASLLGGNGKTHGRAYFLTDGPPTNFFSFFDTFVEAAGYRIRPKNCWLPRWFAYSLGCISESVAFLMRPFRKYSPKMSRFAVTYTCTSYTFCSDKARDDFGFIPKYSRQEAFDHTVEHFRCRG